MVPWVWRLTVSSAIFTIAVLTCSIDESDESSSSNVSPVPSRPVVPVTSATACKNSGTAAVPDIHGRYWKSW